MFPLPSNNEAFYDRLMFVDGDIFELCAMSRPKMKRTILEGLWQIALDLEGRSATKLPKKTILEVAKIMAAVEDEGIHIELID